VAIFIPLVWVVWETRLERSDSDGEKNMANKMIETRDIVFDVAPAGRNTLRLVKARIPDGQIFEDQMDARRAGARNQFASRSVEHSGLDVPSVREHVHAELPRMAEEADARAAEPHAFCVPGTEPWPKPVTLPEVLDEAYAAIKQYIDITDEAAFACALWSAWTHVFDQFDVAPLLVLKSPVKRCGKTSLLTVLSKFVTRPIPTSNISPAALYRVVEEQRPTLLIDEADTWLPNNREARGIINCGHTRDTAFIIRNQHSRPQRFSSWCPKLIAGIGNLPGTIEDRAIIIPLDRKPRDVQVDRLTRKAKRKLEVIGRKFARWAADHAGALDSDAEPADIPPCLNDRAVDNWWPLFILADHAGGHWPRRAREAAAKLSGEEDLDEEDVGIRLLAAIREILPSLPATDFIPTSDLLKALHVSDEWSSFGKGGRPISAPAMAKILRSFNIKPVKTAWNRGYCRESLEQAFRKYLAASPEQSAIAPYPAANDDGKTTYDDDIKHHNEAAAEANSCIGRDGDRAGSHDCCTAKTVRAEEWGVKRKRPLPHSFHAAPATPFVGGPRYTVGFKSELDLRRSGEKDEKLSIFDAIKQRLIKEMNQSERDPRTARTRTTHFRPSGCGCRNLAQTKRRR
jgi:hypothetical protein